MKSVSVPTRGRNRDGLHIEAPGCVVNIRPGLHDMAGNEVTSVQINCDHYAGEPDYTVPDLLTVDEAVKIITQHYGTFDTLNDEQSAAFIREQLGKDRRSINVRVVKANDAA